MRLTVEQLIQPRYRVIAAYPFSPYKIGDIITPKDGHFKIARVVDFVRFEERGAEHYFPESAFLDYPHLFNLAHWSENRTSEEFPEYVYFKSSFKPDSVEKILLTEVDENGFVNLIATDGEPKAFYSPSIFSRPATKEEYEKFKQR